MASTDHTTASREPVLVARPEVAGPPLLADGPVVLHAVIATLALGGAERIVLDWAAAERRRHAIRLVVLRDAAIEHPVPDGVDVVRLHGNDIESALRVQGERIAASGNPVVLCHLLRERERAALAAGGARCVPVLHNARAGWLEPGAALHRADRVVAVSASAAGELRADGHRGSITVVRQVPNLRAPVAGARDQWRARWALPPDAVVVGMIGAVKPQKAYPRALRVLAELCRTTHACLVIVGGPVGADGPVAWRALLTQALRLGVAERVRLAGFVEDAARCLGAFDVFLNTSRYEGLSIATLEALASGLPVVASRAGGQGELGGAGLTLLEFDAPDRAWADAIGRSLASRPLPPPWRGFPSHRLWTLEHLPRPGPLARRVLFVTANLNAGGAQRSLVNLAVALRARIEFSVVVCGPSTSDAFIGQLSGAGVAVSLASRSRDCFDQAEAIVRHACAEGVRTVCFWNVDPKVKLLLAKVLDTAVRLVDVSPGGYAFEEMRATRVFQACVGYDEAAYYARLARLVFKYRASLPDGLRARTDVIPNGVAQVSRSANSGNGAAPRIVVNGRIAPSKFLLEIIAAMARVWPRHPSAELHVLGTAEPSQRDYATAVLEAAGAETGRRIHFHGASFDAPERLPAYDLAIVLGEHQGCPNAVLEAMAAGVPVVANDSGGTRELIPDRRTGVLLADRSPSLVAAAVNELLDDPRRRRRLAQSARRRVARHYGLDAMARAYLRLFRRVAGEIHSC